MGGAGPLRQILGSNQREHTETAEAALLERQSGEETRKKKMDEKNNQQTQSLNLMGLQSYDK